jgi:hypothetical protein
MILETALILGGAIGLIAVQPPLYRLFPPKPKQTEWEEFWTQEAIDARWGKTQPTTLSEAFAAAIQGKSDLARYQEVIKTAYVPQMKQVLEDSSKLFQKIKRETHNKPAAASTGLATAAHTDIEAVDLAVKEGASKVFLPETKQWIDFYTPRFTDKLSLAQSWQSPYKAQAQQDRAAFSADAERRGMQVYLDHATNEYRARETQLSRNLAALEAALGKATFYVGSHTYAFPGGIELSSLAIQSARSAEDVWRLISDKPPPKKMDLDIVEQELRRMRDEGGLNAR